MEKIQNIIADPQGWLAGLETWLCVMILLVVTLAFWAFISGFVPWESLRVKDAKGVKTGTKGKRQLVASIILFVLWLVSTLALFLWVHWTSGTENAQSAQNHGGSESHVWLWWQIIMTIMALALGIIALHKAWKATFWRDERLAVDEPKNAPLPKRLWPAVISAFGFFLCLAFGVWWSWALVGLYPFWRLGPAFMSPAVTERYVPKMLNAFLAGDDDECYYIGNGADKTNSNWFMRLFGLPPWLAFYSLEVASYCPLDATDCTIQLPLSDGSTAAFPFRVKLQIGSSAKRFLEKTPAERKKAVSECIEIAKSHIPNLAATLNQETARTTIDEAFKASPIKGRILAEWIKKGCGTYDPEAPIDFSAPIPDPAITASLNAIKVAENVQAKAKVEADTKKVEAGGVSAANQEIYLARVRGLIAEAKTNGETLSFTAAWNMVLEEQRSTSPRVEIKGGNPSFNMPLPGTNL